MAGSTDNTDRIADAAGCSWAVQRGASRSECLSHGAGLATRTEWLLFLQPETLLESGWHHEAQSFVERATRAPNGGRTAASFRLRYETFGISARFSEFFASLRSQLLGMPYGNQGLLISRAVLPGTLGGSQAAAGTGGSRHCQADRPRPHGFSACRGRVQPVRRRRAACDRPLPPGRSPVSASACCASRPALRSSCTARAAAPSGQTER